MAHGHYTGSVLVFLLLSAAAAAQAQPDAAPHNGLIVRMGRLLSSMRSLAAASQAGTKQTSSSSSSTAGSSPDNPRSYTLDVTVGERSPDCVSRKVILINGEFQPTLTFTQGDWVEVSNR